MTTNGFYWPSPEALVQGKYNYDSTREIQNHYSQAGTMPRLSLDTRTLDWAKSYLKAKSRGRLPVAVHLKNNPNVRGESNADMDSWFAFISECQGKHAAHFILVGDDPVDARLRSLSNVTVARDDKVSLDGYLALIQIAGLFMGMMSGPANMALFGTNPYLIFKNPDHHVREMAIELGENDHYPFALPHQRVLRVWDTAENLASAFESVFDQVAALKFTKIIERHL